MNWTVKATVTRSEGQFASLMIMRAALEAIAPMLGQGKDAWQPMDTAPRTGRILGVVEGCVRFIYWGKTSHVPIYGWNLGDQGVEDCELCEPTHWMPVPNPPKPQPPEAK